jgi:chromosome segregation ATPase
MTDDLPNDAKDLRNRVRGASEETIGRLAQDLLSNPLVTGAVQRAMEIRERATQAQEAAFGALNMPTAADIERLTRRVRNVAQRLESIEDAIDRVDERIATAAGKGGDDAALAAISSQLAEVQASLAALSLDEPTKPAK